MSYNNNYNRNDNQYNSQRNGNQSSGYNRNSGAQQGPGKKRSGCRQGVGKNGNSYISAWKVNKRDGFVTLIASPHVDKSTGEIKQAQSKSGQLYTLMVCKISAGYAAPVLHTGFYNPVTGKMHIPNCHLVASTKAPNGGYFGKSGKPKR